MIGQDFITRLLKRKEKPEESGLIQKIVVQEVVPEKTEAGWKTTFVVLKVSDIALDRKELDSAKEIIRRADKARILQATDAIREKLREENLVKALPEGEEEGRRKDFDVKEGDTGVYAVQEHEMGLTEESAKSKTPREKLQDTGNVHNDIRMRVRGKDYLVGLTTTIGSLKMRNKLLTIKEGEKVLVPAFKLKQPLVWLDIGKTTYRVFEPGEVGARERSWARMKRVDYGKFKIGTVDEHYIEIWFDGSKLKGRYILQYVPVEDGRKWMISKPQEQTMDAEREKGGKEDGVE